MILPTLIRRCLHVRHLLFKKIMALRWDEVCCRQEAIDTLRSCCMILSLGDDDTALKGSSILVDAIDMQSLNITSLTIFVEEGKARQRCWVRNAKP